MIDGKSFIFMRKNSENNEDINFYQEILYRFYKEQERENIKYLVINFAEQKQQILHYSFPRMPLSEIKKPCIGSYRKI